MIGDRAGGSGPLVRRRSGSEPVGSAHRTNRLPAANRYDYSNTPKYCRVFANDGTTSLPMRVDQKSKPGMSNILPRIVPATLLILLSTPHGSAQEAAAPPPAVPKKLAVDHLPNAYRLHERVISGGLPEGDAAFKELRALGVQTVISVDGARPDVKTAARHGLRYVHLPHGYDGIPPERIAELAKAVRDLPGPVYIHCHHGKHRSPAAASAACVAAGLLPQKSALSILTTAGTSKNYRGLYEAAQSAHRLDDQFLDAFPADFPETAEIPEMAESMVHVEHTHDHLKLFAANDWRKLEEHPDLEPAHEALLLREHFTELLRTPVAQQQPAAFQAILRESEQAAQMLEDHLRAGRTAEACTALELVTKHCTACHHDYRDTPLSEKQ